MRKQALETVKYIRKISTTQPTIGVVLGSGLGDLAYETEQKQVFHYDDLPHFPKVTVSGHKGRLIIGKLQGVPVVMMQGRFHYYEGYSFKEIGFPMKVMKLLGVKTVLITNAAGGINRAYAPGDLMVITDHIQLIRDNHPVTPMKMPSFIYSRELIRTVSEVALSLNISLQRGVYAAVPGPAYETPAEIQMLRCFGVDAVGMSTAPEATFAQAQNLDVLGISCISNMAAGILDNPLSHDEVIETTMKVKQTFQTLMKTLIEKIGREDVR